MARKRMIDPHFWESQDVNRLNHFERLILIGLFSNADDFGKGNAVPTYIRSIVFPYEDISVLKIENALNNIKNSITIIFYSVDGCKYYCFPNWKKWQNVSHPVISNIPDYDSTVQFGNDSGMNRDGLHHSVVKYSVVKDSVVKDSISEEKIYFENPILQNAFLSFIEFRIKIKAEMTDYAIELAVSKLNKKCETDEERIETLNNSIIGGYKGLFPKSKPKIISPQKKSIKDNFEQREYPDEVLESLYFNSDKEE